MAEHDEDDYDEDRLLPGWRTYLQRFPDVGAALEAARRGADASVELEDVSYRYRQRAVPSAEEPGGTVECLYFLDYWDVLETAVINAAHDGAPNYAVLLDATAGWVRGELARCGLHALEIVALSPGEGVDSEGYQPLLGVLERVDVAGSEQWNEVPNEAFQITRLIEDGIGAKPPVALIGALVSAGARVVRCAGCGEFITNGIPDFEGAWIAHKEDSAISCSWSWPPKPHRPVVLGNDDAPVA